ncbi:hypothetical protein, partial [Bacillus atrophaeus]
YGTIQSLAEHLVEEYQDEWLTQFPLADASRQTENKKTNSLPDANSLIVKAQESLSQMVSGILKVNVQEIEMDTEQS